MRQHQAAGVQLGLEAPAVDARLRRDGHGGLVDIEDGVQRAQVEQDAAVDRERPALGPGAAAPRHDRCVLRVRCGQHGCHILLLRGRTTISGRAIGVPAASAASAGQ